MGVIWTARWSPARSRTASAGAWRPSASTSGGSAPPPDGTTRAGANGRTFAPVSITFDMRWAATREWRSPATRSARPSRRRSPPRQRSGAGGQDDADAFLDAEARVDHVAVRYHDDVAEVEVVRWHEDRHHVAFGGGRLEQHMARDEAEGIRAFARVLHEHDGLERVPPLR